MAGVVVFRKLGWVLLFVALFTMIATAYFLPALLGILGLSMPGAWGPIARLVVQITVGSWVATVVISIARVTVWLYADLTARELTKYERDRRDVLLVRDFTLWVLGIMTVLAAYATSWFI